jgi:hypothetical protein
MNLPPPEEIYAAITQVALPAFAVAGMVALLGRWYGPLRPWALMLALVLGFLAGNYARQGWRFSVGSADLSAANLWTGIQTTVLPPQGEDDGPKPPPSRTWLPWLVVLAMIAGQGVRRFPEHLAWRLRDFIALVAAFFLGGSSVMVVALVVAIVALWEVLERLGETCPGMAVPAALSVTLSVGACVLIHAHSASLTDTATALSAALGGIALACLMGGDARACYPGVAIALPGLMWVGYDTTFSEVPAMAFVAVSLAPVMLASVWLPPVAKRPVWVRLLIGAAALSIPLAGAMAFAMAYESLDFG